jgi:hypothetical protein
MPMNKSWLTRPLVICPPHVARVLKAGMLLAIVLLVIAPTLVTLTWHLRHGDTIECRGELIFVPSRWTADIGDGNNVMLTKLPLIIPLIPRATSIPEWISVGQAFPVRGETIEDRYKTFKSIFSNLHSDLGDAVSGPVRIGSGPQEAFCMEGATPKTTRSSVSCMVLGGKWTADFMGDRKDMDEFFTIIRKLN